MIEVHSKLFVGDESDYSRIAGVENWAIVHACKEPFHRQAVGYSGKAAPKGHPEYLIARRGNRLMMNIVDAENPMFFDRIGLITPALDFVDEQRTSDRKVLIHCNEGHSRSPSLALLYLAMRLQAIPAETFNAAETAFMQLYSGYHPKAGIRGHIRANWEQYRPTPKTP